MACQFPFDPVSYFVYQGQAWKNIDVMNPVATTKYKSEVKLKWLNFYTNQIFNKLLQTRVDLI